MKSITTFRNVYTWIKLSPKQVRACSDVELRFLSDLRELVSRCLGETPLHPNLPVDSPINDYPEGWDCYDGINALFTDGIVYAHQEKDLLALKYYTELIENGVGYGFLIPRGKKGLMELRPFRVDTWIQSPFDLVLLDELVHAIRNNFSPEALRDVISNPDVLSVDYGSYTSALNWNQTRNDGNAPAVLNFVLRRFADKGIFLIPTFTLIVWMSKVTMKSMLSSYDLAEMIERFYNEYQTV